MRLPCKRHRAVGTGCAVAAAVVLVAGCGGGGKAQPTPAYVRAVDAVASRLDSVTNHLSTPTDASSAAAELTEVQTALRKAARELAAITPPPAIKEDHARLVKAVSELAAGVTPVVAKLKAGDTPSGGSQGDGSQGDDSQGEDSQGEDDPLGSLVGAAQARAAIAAITKAGYKIQIQLLD